MDRYKVTVYPFGKEITLNVKAKSMDEAVESVLKMPITSVLDRLTIDDFTSGYGASTIEPNCPACGGTFVEEEGWYLCDTPGSCTWSCCEDEPCGRENCPICKGKGGEE